MDKLASTMLDSAKQIIDENPNLVTGLLAAGGAGALGGAVLTGPSDDPNETASSRRMRRLKNALLGAGMAAGATGLTAYGLHNFKTALPENDVDPVTQAWYSPFTRLLGAGTAGVAAAGANAKLSGKNAQDMLNMTGLAQKDVKRPVEYLQRSILGERDNLAKVNAALANTTDKKQIAKLTKMRDATVMGQLQNKLGGTEAISNELRRAGVSTKGLSRNVDLQGILGKPGSSLEKLTRLTQRLGGRHIARNKWVYGAGLAGLALPEAGSALQSYLGKLLSNSSVGNE